MKKSIIPVAAFIAGMAIVPSVFAADSGVDNSIDDIAKLAECVSEGKQAVCTYAGEEADLVENAGYFDVKKDVTIDLGGKKLTVKSSANTDGAFQIADDATLTITNGAIEAENAYTGAVFDVNKGGSLVLNADVKASKPIDATEPEKVVVNSAVYATSTNAALAVAGANDTFGTTASVVEINGRLVADALGNDNYVYTQEGYVNATIKGGISTTKGRGISFANGTLNLTGATVSARGLAIIMLGGNASKTATINCSTITSTDSAALYFNGNVVVDALTIKNSTLTSTNKSTINGGDNSEVKTVTIDGSRFVAKSDAKVKIGGTNFVKATYDGKELAEDENVLTEAEGSYGTLAACDADAADEGEDNGEESENPNTADTIATYMTIAAVALLGLGATAFVAKKSNR